MNNIYLLKKNSRLTIDIIEDKINLLSTENSDKKLFEIVIKPNSKDFIFFKSYLTDKTEELDYIKKIISLLPNKLLTLITSKPFSSNYLEQNQTNIHKTKVSLKVNSKIYITKGPFAFLHGIVMKPSTEYPDYYFVNINLFNIDTLTVNNRFTSKNLYTILLHKNEMLIKE